TCYSSNMLVHLKNNGLFYLFKCINENTATPFWVFDRTNKLNECLASYNYDLIVETHVTKAIPNLETQLNKYAI
ncbi:MAG: hypothetical protein RSA99_05170, partial [Oscillospiraceae bacterium]